MSNTLALDVEAPMQWRGSDDALQWTKWEHLPSIESLVPVWRFIQARILVNGIWHVSPIVGYAEDWPT